MLRFLLILLLFLCDVALAQNARGILRLKGEFQELRPGETYDFDLTILPFTSSALTPEMFEAKTFLDYFYVTKIYQIEQSENNFEATVVKLQAVLARSFGVKPVYIWTLGDRNIPIEVQNFVANGKKKDKEDSQKEFTIHETGEKYSKGFSKKKIILALLLLLLAISIGVVYFRKRKLIKGDSELKRLVSLLKKASTHSEFEEIYLQKGKFFELLFREEESRREFIQFLDMYRIDQFSTNWSNRDINDLISAKQEIVKRGDFGS